MQSDYDDYDAYEPEGGFNWVLVAVLLLAVACFFALAWYAYETGTKPVEGGEVVVIKADPDPVKTAPEDPGGIAFPHQDKTIYEAVEPGEDGSVEVVLMPEAEEPEMPEPEPEAALQPDEAPTPADQKIAEIIQQAVRDTQQQQTENRPVGAAQPEAVAPKPKPEPQPLVTDDPFEPAGERTKSPADPTQPQPDTPPALTGERIQLGAFRNHVEAEKHWRKLVRAHKDVLEGKPHQVIRADLGQRGVFYRLRAAGFDTAQEAKAACDALSRRGQGCFVVQ